MFATNDQIVSMTCVTLYGKSINTSTYIAEAPNQEQFKRSFQDHNYLIRTVSKFWIKN